MRARAIVEERSDQSTTYRLEKVSCGKARCGKCGGCRPAHGPYWYAYWKENGRTRSRYVGKFFKVQSKRQEHDVLRATRNEVIRAERRR